MLSSILLVLVMALVAVWALQVIVFALLLSVMSRRSRPSARVIAAQERMRRRVLEAEAEKPAA